MSSSLSPDHAERASSNDGPNEQENDALESLNLGFLKGLTEKRTTREGQPPKRRGPKPDSKPALTRRQELNRQAQRTHRERKELYIKALEDEVLRLKEIFTSISQDKEKLAYENKQLKDALARNGVALDDAVSNPGASHSSRASASVTSHTPGSRTVLSPPSTSQSTAPSVTSSNNVPPYGQNVVAGHQVHDMTAHASGQSGVDLEQAGIDFVLTVTKYFNGKVVYDVRLANVYNFVEETYSLERPCMDHMPWLCEKTAEKGDEPCGHALMASCPPGPFQELTPDIPFGCQNIQDQDAGGQQTWELTRADLSTLLDLSQRLNLDGEITPIMAWGMIMAHPRFRGLKPDDFRKLAGELGRKVRCYGFGAVMEEFEIRDALENVLNSDAEMEMG